MRDLKYGPLTVESLSCKRSSQKDGMGLEWGGTPFRRVRNGVAHTHSHYEREEEMVSGFNFLCHEIYCHVKASIFQRKLRQAESA